MVLIPKPFFSKTCGYLKCNFVIEVAIRFIFFSLKTEIFLYRLLAVACYVSFK